MSKPIVLTSESGITSLVKDATTSWNASLGVHRSGNVLSVTYSITICVCVRHNQQRVFRTRKGYQKIFIGRHSLFIVFIMFLTNIFLSHHSCLILNNKYACFWLIIHLCQVLFMFKELCLSICVYLTDWYCFLIIRPDKKLKKPKIRTNKTTTTKTTICICWLVVYLFKRYEDNAIGAKVLQCRSIGEGWICNLLHRLWNRTLVLRKGTSYGN